jgi:phosphoesterase RecJ-like protein
MIDTTDFRKVIELINNSTNVLLTSHTRPDGDACGSVRAMSDMLIWLGKKAQPIFLSPIAPWYEFLFEQKVPILGNDVTRAQLDDEPYASCDLVIIIDTNSYVQLPEFDQWLRETNKKVLVIDHHVTGDNLGDIELLDPSAAAAGEIIYDLIKYANWPVSLDVAEALFVAIASDSGWFRFSNADARIYRNAAELIDAGVVPATVYQKLYQNFAPTRLKLMARMLGSLEMHCNDRVAFQHILRKDFEETGATGRETENLIDQCQQINSVRVAVLFVELKDGFRCSLRSKSKLDVRSIAQKFGGGGHTMAAGVNLPRPLKKAKKLILDEIKKQL